MQMEQLLMDGGSKTPCIILRGIEDREQILRIPIGAHEAMNISMLLNFGELPRPLPHDLILLAIAALQGLYVHSEITAFEDGIFYAALLIRQGTKFTRIDSRACDAIALAIRAGKPILVNDTICSMAEEEFIGILPNDAAMIMVRSTNARHMVDMMSLARHYSGGIPSEDDPERDDKLLDLLRQLEPQTKHRM